jgi:multidrug efflux pump subunit AcrA (membrane-fusion protein)
LRPGLSVDIGVQAHPGKKWEGVVYYLYPGLDPKTGTLGVRLVFPNPDLLLKPNMFAEVVIYVSTSQQQNAVPQLPVSNRVIHMQDGLMTVWINTPSDQNAVFGLRYSISAARPSFIA